MSHRFMFTGTSVLLLVAALSIAGEPAKTSKPTADRVKLVRAMYEKLPCEILGFAEPSKNLIAAASPDEGSVGIILLDAKDKKLAIFLDRKQGTKTPDSLYLNIDDGVRLPHRGPEESAVYGLLLRLPKADRDKVKEVLKVLDQRFAGAMPIKMDK